MDSCEVGRDLAGKFGHAERLGARRRGTLAPERAGVKKNRRMRLIPDEEFFGVQGHELEDAGFP